jgi:beta-lactamase class A
MKTLSRSNVRPILAALAITTSLFGSASARADDAAFEQTIRNLIRAHRGKVTVAIKPLAGGTGLYLDADEEMPTASLIKFMVMLEAYQQALEGKIKLDTPVILRKEDRVPGSGILTYHFSDGATFPLRDAVRLMIVFSDNTATNLVLDQIGIASTGTRMKEWGCPKTKIHAKVFRGDTTSIDKEGSKRFGLGVTTAREAVTLLEKLHRQEVATPALCKEMLGHLKKCEDKTKLKRLLPAGIEVAHKTGSVKEVKTDAGILYLKSGPVAVCVMTRDNQDTRFHDDNAANILIGKIGMAVADHFGGK